MSTVAPPGRWVGTASRVAGRGGQVGSMGSSAREDTACGGLRHECGFQAAKRLLTIVNGPAPVGGHARLSRSLSEGRPPGSSYGTALVAVSGACAAASAR